MTQAERQTRMPSAARAWLAEPGLARLWDQIHERLQRNGIAIRGRVVLADISHAEREALGLLMGRAYSGERASIPLPDLDQRLRLSAAGCGLAEAAAELRGQIIDKPGERNARQAERDQVWAAADEARRTSLPGEAAWAQDWLADVRRTGTLSRLTGGQAATVIRQACMVLGTLAARLSAEGAARDRAWTSRGELAERVTGTAHGLDDDTVLARLVLRGLARYHGRDFPQDSRGRRELWEVSSVTTDQVSSTVLTYRLMPIGDDWPARSLRERSLAMAETHLTMRDVRRIEWRVAPGTEIFVCENPRVVEAAMDAACRRPVVCTSGNPTTTVMALLDALTGSGARIAYRGDFDWPGIAMANRIINRYEAEPWRMSAADYEEHVSEARSRGTPLQSLSGKPVRADWDPELTPAMQAHGVGIQEESALELLVSDLEPQSGIHGRS